jgi:lipoprotein-anchoring transpeptidase ErfK/SrfK
MFRLALLLTSLSLIMACSASAQAPPVLPAGASVGGLAVGGLTLPEATARIEARFGAWARSKLQVRVGGHRLHLTRRGGRLGLDALASARNAQTGGDVSPVVAFDRKRLEVFLDRVERKGTRDPRNARLRYAVTRLKVARARDGLRVDRDTAREQIVAALSDPAAPRILRVRLRHIRPKVTKEDLAERHPVVVTVHRRGFRLRLFEDLERAASYRVAVGMPGHATPGGRFTIANKAVDPAWTAPDAAWAGAYRNEVVAGGSAENPLKARWLGIVDGVGIHGTGATWSLGTAASHGCIRMSVSSVKRLYERVPVGALVMIK